MDLLDSIQACLQKKLDEKTCNKLFLRVGMMAELDAINLYETMAGATSNKRIKKIMLDVAKEEKTHVGEFQFLLRTIDSEYAEELEHGEDEVEDFFIDEAIKMK